MTKDEDLRLALDALERIKGMAAQATDALDIADIREAAWSALAAISALSAPAAQPVPAVQPLSAEARDAIKDRAVSAMAANAELGWIATLIDETERACAEAWGVQIGGANG